jgi:hypothetical protein
MRRCSQYRVGDIEGYRDRGGYDAPTTDRAVAPFGRASYIAGTAALDAGVPLRDVQEAAFHVDPRTTMRYDRARTSLDRHATCIVATYIAGAAK